MRANRVRLWGSGLLLVLFLLVLGVPAGLRAEEKKGGTWSGVDESIVEKYAKEHGREAREPYINTDQGDLLLFVFLLGGAAGGFLAGYSWRNLMDRKPEGKDACVKTTPSAPAGKERI
ncbi:MAG: hypothetical protein U0411_11660 [Thermodesulfovibrionales bacterium]